MDIGTFRQDYTEFTDTTKYPDGLLTYWLNIAIALLNPNRWQDQLDMATELFMAHNIMIEKMARDTAAVNGWPGYAKGPLSSESPGGTSLSYDTSAVQELDAGHWNYTVYGTRFIRLARMFGAGPIQIGAGCDWGVGQGFFLGPVASLGWYQ
jgi:hypothetical protein